MEDSAEGIDDPLKDQEDDSWGVVESDQDLKLVNWEEFHEALVHLGGISVVLTQLRQKRESLASKLQAVIEVGTQASQRVDALEVMERQLQEKKRSADNSLSSLRTASAQLVDLREKLIAASQGLLVSAKALASAQGRIQEADKLLAGEAGHGRWLKLRKLLDARRRQMVDQVASLYPLATCTSLGSSSSTKHTNSNAQPPVAYADATYTGSERAESSSFASEDTSMAIAGLQILVPIKRQPGLFNEKNDYETSATALGYVAHVVTLVATYLDVQLRYPVRLGASRSYVQDHCPATEPMNLEMGAVAVPLGNSPKTLVEFPLFSEGQELTRSAYAVFLLNKDLEQVLNRLGIDFVGPRHTLPNLNRLLTTVTSGVHPLA